MHLFEFSSYFTVDGTMKEGITLERIQSDLSEVIDETGHVTWHEYMTSIRVDSAPAEDAEPVEFIVNSIHSESFKGSSLEEAATDTLPENVLMRVKMPQAQMADRKNRNNRVYAYDDMKVATNDMNERSQQGEIFILGGHPDPSSIPKATDVAGINREAQFNTDTAYTSITFDIIEGPQGRAIVNILKAGGSLPISSRALGKAEFVRFYDGKKGKIGRSQLPTESQDEYYTKVSPFMVMREFKFETFDFVAGTQSVPTAIHRRGASRNVQMKSEGTNPVSEGSSLDSPTTTPATTPEDAMNLKELKEKDPAAYEALVIEARTALLEAAGIKDLSELVERTKELADLNEQLTAELEEAQEELRKALEATKSNEAPTESESDKQLRLALEKLNASEKREARRDMLAYVTEKVNGGKYSKFGPLIIPNIVNENSVPKDKAAADKAIEAVETYVGVVLAHGRRLGDGALPAPGKGTVELENEKLQSAQLMAEIWGDTESENDFSR